MEGSRHDNRETFVIFARQIKGEKPQIWTFEVAQAFGKALGAMIARDSGS